MTNEQLVAEVAALRRQLVDQARLADAIPHIVWTTDADGTPTYFNSKWTEYTQLDLAETLRVGAGSFVHPDDLAPFAAKMAEATAPPTNFGASGKPGAKNPQSESRQGQVTDKSKEKAA